MNTSFEYLEQGIQKQKWKKKVKSFLNEIKILIIMFVISFVWMLLFTNAELFFWWDNSIGAMNWKKNTAQEDNSISTTVDNMAQRQAELDKLIASYDGDEIEKETAVSSEQDLKSQLSEYKFDFNVLPPTNRIVISKIWLDVPLVDSKYKDEVDFTQWNFADELENGVVKDPTTPEPWYEWNTLIF